MVYAPYFTFNDFFVKGTNRADACIAYKSGDRTNPFLKINLKYINDKTECDKVIEDSKKVTPAMLIEFNNEPNKAQVNEWIDRINKMEYVTNVEFTSSDEAERLYIEANKSNPIHAHDVTNAVVFPSSIKIYLSNWSIAEKMKADIEKEDNVKTVLTYRDPSSY